MLNLHQMISVFRSLCVPAAIVIALCASGCAGMSSAASDTASASSGASLGSNASSVTVPNSSSLDYVAPSTRILFASPEAFAFDNSQLRSDVIQEQCDFRTPDPPIMIPNEEASNWTFAGRLEAKSPYVEALEYRRILLPGKSGPEQMNTWPVKLETLSAMPDAYLQERLSSLNKAKLDGTEEQTLMNRYLRESAQIGLVTAGLEKNYSPGAECPTSQSGR